MFGSDKAEHSLRHSPVELVVDFRNTELRLAAISELIRSHGANTYMQIEICAHYYKQGALKELFPNRASIFRPEKRSKGCRLLACDSDCGAGRTHAGVSTLRVKLAGASVSCDSCTSSSTLSHVHVLLKISK
jgi:hypothetical protein